MDEVTITMPLEEWLVVLMGLDWVHHNYLAGMMGDNTDESIAVDIIYGRVNSHILDKFPEAHDMTGKEAVNYLSRNNPK